MSEEERANKERRAGPPRSIGAISAPPRFSSVGVWVVLCARRPRVRSPLPGITHLSCVVMCWSQHSGRLFPGETPRRRARPRDRSSFGHGGNPTFLLTPAAKSSPRRPFLRH